MAQRTIGTSRLAQRTSGRDINANFAELFGSLQAATVTPKSANYTLTTADASTILRFSTGSTLTLPNNLPVGFQVAVVQAGAAQVSVSAASGATLVSRSNYTKTAGQWAIINLIVVSNGSGTQAQWLFVGDGAV